MLRIPSEGEATAPLMVPLKKIEFSENEDDPRGEKRTRKTRKKKEMEAVLPEWDKSSGTWRSRKKNKGKQIFKAMMLWGAITGVVIAGAFYYQNAMGVAQDVAESGDKADSFEELVGSPLIMPEEAPEDVVKLPKVMEQNEAEFLKVAEPLARKFLAAESLDQLIPLIYNAKGMNAKIRDYYPDGKIKPTSLAKFNASGKVSYRDAFAAVSITTGDFEKKQIAFIDGEDGLRIDWESWVGWSEMPWDEFLKKKPEKPQVFRVMLKLVDYYNFGFSDESAWRSYRLISPDGENLLYGYVERNSLLDQRLRPGEPTATVAVTLKIHFREGEQSSQQVVIDDYISDGWVVVAEPEK